MSVSMRLGNAHAAPIAAILFLAAPAMAQAQTAASCLGVTFANPSTGRPICSKSFNFTGDCNGGDMVYSWTIAGRGGWQVKPWENQPIDIIGVEVVDASGSPHSFWMVGNNHAPDPMAWVGPNQWHTSNIFPTGFSWPFPASSRAATSDYFDLHGACSSGSASLWVTFYYAPERGASLPPHPP
jgi:hypothetical protein